MKGTWQTTDSGGGGGLGVVVLIIVGAALLGPAVAAAATAVAVAVAELVHIVLIIVGVLLGLAAAGLVALAAVHAHRWRAGGTVQRSLPAPPWQRTVQGAPSPRAVQPSRVQRPAIEQHVHHHWHGVTPEDVAAIIRRQEEEGR